MNKKIKIAILTLSRFENNKGQGIPRYINELYTNMNGKDHILVERKTLANIPFIGDAASFELQSNFIDLSEYSIVHNPIGFNILHGHNRRYKYIITAHDLNPISKGTLSYDLWYKWFFKRGTIYNIHNADHIIADSYQTKRELMSFGAKQEKISVVSLGVDKRFLTSHLTKKSSQNFNVGYLGAFVKNKNVIMLLKAFRYLDDKFTLDLYGKPSELYNELLSYSKSLGKRINFRGVAPEADIIKIYGSFDVFVYPSLYEGFGLPIIEAQSCGIPVVIYKNGKIPEEVSKYCFKAANPKHLARIIMQLRTKGYDDTERRTAMEYARTFTWERTINETVKVYNTTLEG